LYKTSPSLTEPGIHSYLAILDQLCTEGFLKGTVVYPACGVDTLVALFADKLVSVNWHPYKAEDILTHLQPIVGPDLAAALQKVLPVKAEFLSRINASNACLLTRALSRYENSTPKTLLLKGLFDSLFLQEWDLDMERFYDVLPMSAIASANEWIGKMVSWLQDGDKVICFDDQMVPALDSQWCLLKCKEFRSEGESNDIIRRCGIPIIYLANEAILYEKKGIVPQLP